MSRLTARAGAALVLACAGVVTAASASASRASTAATDSFTLSAQPIYAQAEAAPAPPRKPLMAALDKMGAAKTLDDWNINIGGLVEAGWTYNFDDPAGGINVGRVFDFEDQDPTLDQLMVFVERTVDPSKGKFDVGGRMEWMWGGDARVIHSNGLFDHYGLADGPDEQFDLTQLYVDVGIPVGNGLTVRAGKFTTLLGYELINPSGNALYSHSYLFGFAIPFTNTGVLGIYPITDKVTVTAGITRGWEQSLEDNNDSIDFMGQVKWVASDKVTLYFNGITGPEQTDNDSNYRTVLDGIATIAVSDELSLAVNGDFGWEADAAADGGSALWYGVAGYAGYKISDYFTLNGRVEWFNDDDGARGLGTNVYEATFGVAIRPMGADPIGQNLVIRPEVRYDYSDDDIFDGATQNDQWTFGVDALFTF